VKPSASLSPSPQSSGTALSAAACFGMCMIDLPVTMNPDESRMPWNLEDGFYRFYVYIYVYIHHIQILILLMDSKESNSG
jgi:hypothetical protein